MVRNKHRPLSAVVIGLRRIFVTFKKSSLKKRLLTAVLAIAILLSGVGLYMDNTRVDIETVSVKIDGLPEDFDGMRIAQLSDMHYPHCVLPPDRLAALVEKQHPDLIVLTGDSNDRFSRFDIGDLAELARKLSAIAPCYAVAGNHEAEAHVLDQWTDLMRENGVTVLDNEWTSFQRNGSVIGLGGLTDGNPSECPDTEPTAGVKIVLSHFPQFIKEYAGDGYSLVLSGHAHGGQVRIFGQGLFAPGQGLFPKYTSGLYRLGATQMVVSRGLKDGLIPLRVFNAPHLPVIVLTK